MRGEPPHATRLGIGDADVNIVRTALLLVVLLVPAAAVAHEGHDHKQVMGTIERIDNDRIVVKAKLGSTVTILLKDDTKYRGVKGGSSREDLQVGDRVVVKAMHQGSDLAADAIRFSHAKATPGEKKSPGTP